MVLRLAMVVTALLLAGCGGDDEEAATTGVDTTAESSNCVAASSDIMTPLGNQVTLADGRVSKGQMVESEAKPGTWFVAVELDGTGYEDAGDVAVFATANRFGGDAIYAVDEIAKEHTDWRDVEEAEGIDPADPAADEAADCVG
jgi:hypothetical protein